jgi:xanthine/uracil permease
MINNILLSIYLAVGIFSWVIAYMESEFEDKISMSYKAGIILGILIWPIGVIVSLIIDGIKHKDNVDEEA